jgi:8-oxo-dGTP pyrophosphatase MutT (NUDIX family)
MSSSREQLLADLRQYVPWDPEDARSADRIVDFLERVPDAFQRSTAEGHMTGSAWVVSNSGDRVLLLHHRKLDKWLQPGGHADGEEDLLAVAAREAREECGLISLRPVSSKPFDVDVHLIPARAVESEHYHYDVRYAFVVEGSEAVVKNEESLNVTWFSVEALELVSQEWSILRMRDKWLRDGTRHRGRSDNSECPLDPNAVTSRNGG